MADHATVVPSLFAFFLKLEIDQVSFSDALPTLFISHLGLLLGGSWKLHTDGLVRIIDQSGAVNAALGHAAPFVGCAYVRFPCLYNRCNFLALLFILSWGRNKNTCNQQCWKQLSQIMYVLFFHLPNQELNIHFVFS